MTLGAWYRYSQWDGSQDPFPPDPAALVEELADDVLEHGDVRRALRDLMRRGMEGDDGKRLPGLRDLMERLQQRRQQMLERFNMNSVVQDLKEKLDDVLKTERAGIDKRLDEAQQQLEGMDPADAEQNQKLMDLLKQRADRNREKLDQMPDGLGGAIKELQEYDFMDPEAQGKFQDLMDELRKQMMGNVASELKNQIEQMTPEQMSQMREMMRDINDMLRDRRDGFDPDFDGFMDKWGDMFGPNPPQSLDELMEMMAQQMGQMQALMNSMSAEQRRELFEAMNAAMDDATAAELAEFAGHMFEMMPFAFEDEFPFTGAEDLSLDQAMDMMGHMQSMEELESQLLDVMRRGSPEDIDHDLLEEILGEDARRELEELDNLTKKLEEAGYLQRKGDRLELSPAGIRKIGDKALRELFANLRRGRGGQHELNERGAGGELADDTKPYEFGDPFELHLHKTVMNAVERQGQGTPVRIGVEDFEVVRHEQTTTAATVLLLDMSRSMVMWGTFGPAKKVAIALDALVRTKYPRDFFKVVGFGGFATEIKTQDLPTLQWSGGSGTNIQHALATARKMLSSHKEATKQIFLITDGEPTAHMEGGYPYFSYPPSYRTLNETLREARRCTAEGITINVFMLDDSVYLQDFVNRLVRINNGRALYSTADNLGQYVIVDYLTNRTKKVR